jgi:DNA-binding NtrC family response regulator
MLTSRQGQAPANDSISNRMAGVVGSRASSSPPQPNPHPATHFTAGADRLPPMHLLIVEDDPPVRMACAEIATGLGLITQTADSVPSARLALAKHPADLVLLDLKLPGVGGLSLLSEIRTDRPDTVVVIMTAFATVTSAVEAMRNGATDYITKPFTVDELSTVLERAGQRRVFDAESRALRERLRSGRGLGDLVGRSQPMEKLYRILSKVAHTTHPVLILGESGTGKELVARSIHLNGPNAAKPFIPVDCGSLVPTLIESELFGHVKGAFTGANRTKTGLLAAADGGTVFLDEIGELPLDLQARLLRALQEKEVRPVGSTQSVPISARILAATNRDLPAMVETGRFRKDLYFRLNVVNLRIPALRERRGDIPVLAAHFLDRLRREGGMAHTFSDDSLRLLMEYDWPGNVRELEHAIERACALSSGPILHLGDFPTQLQNHRLQTGETADLPTNGAGSASLPVHDSDTGGVLSIAEMEKQAILNTIRQLKGDKLMAARLLGIGKTTLYRKLKEYGLGDETS